MNRTVKIILGVVIVLILMAASGGVGFALGNRAGAQSASARLQQFVAERTGGDATLPGGQAFRQGNTWGGNAPIAGQMPMRGGMTGVIEQVTDNSIKITMRNQTFAVRLDSQTKIYKSTDGTLADLEPGDTILITGESAADGTLTARSIQLMP